MSKRTVLACAIVLLALPLIAATFPSSLTFSNKTSLLPFGSSEPEIALNGGLMAIASLSWSAPNGGNPQPQTVLAQQQ